MSETSEKENLEQPEYSFEAGVQEALRRILEIAQSQKFTVVAFNSTGEHVGKTTLATRLVAELHSKNIFAIISHDLKDKDEIERLIKKYSQHQKVVIIIDEFYTFGAVREKKHKENIDYYNSKVKECFNNTGLKVEKVDLWVGICRADKPFLKSFNGEPTGPFADIVIEDESAR